MDLKINPDDRLAPGPKPSNRPIIIATLLACTLIGGFGWKMYKEDQEEARKQESLARHHAELQRQEDEWRAEEEARRKKVERTPHYYELNPQEHKAPKPITIAEPLKAQPGKRQTVFNDQNYQPKGASNVVPPPPQRHFSNRQPARRAADPVIQRTAPWRWDSVVYGGNKRSYGGTFSYTVQGGRVDPGSVCRNETAGSIRYRDCRKGAKAYFTQRCRSGDSVACSGQNMTP